MEHLKLKLKMLLIVLFTGTLFSALNAQVTLQGIVKDSNGEPVPGAAVRIANTDTGTATNIDGKFAILDAPQSGTLTVESMGYETYSEAYTGDYLFNIVLRDNNQLLEELVVIGYGSVKKKDLTGSVTAIKPDEKNKGLATNVQDVLAGKIPGLSIVSESGLPGSSSTIRIRGGSSLNASNDPLIVIDGLAMDGYGIQGVANPLTLVNPNDIESVTVLKDASSTAIYGSRASNGVIIITTKKAAKGKGGSTKPQISYNGNVSSSNLVKKYEVFNAAELKQYAQDLKIPTATQEQYFGNADTDWQDEIYRMALGTDHSLSVSGVTGDLPYRVGLGYTYLDGIIKTSNYQRVTGSVTLNPSLFDQHLTFNINAKGMYNTNRFADGGVVGAAIAMDPSNPVYDDALKTYFGGYYQRSIPFNGSDGTPVDPQWTQTYNNQTAANPLATLEQKDDKSKAYSLIGNVEADYKIHGFEDLHLHANVGIDYSHGSQRTVISPYSSSNNYYGWDGTNVKDKYNVYYNLYGQYLKDLSETQHLDLTAGYEYQKRRQEGLSNGYGLYRDTHPTLAGEKYNEIVDKPFDYNQVFTSSFFGRLNYNAFDKYLFTATVRYDGSSNFHPDRRWGLFPSAAFAWKITEEDFAKDISWLSNLKLRLGWGITGQQQISDQDAPYLAIYDQSTEHGYYPLGETDASGNYIYYNQARPRAVNEFLTWEKTTTYNLGIDFGFLKDRLTGSIDVYKRITDDLLNQVDLPAGSNFKNKVISNIGSLENTGVEFMISGKPVVTRDFTWDLGLTVAYNQNEITKLTSGDNEGYSVGLGDPGIGTGNTVQAHRVGYPASSFLVYETKVDENGKYYFVDRDGNGTINESDMYMYHSPAAPLTLGLTSTFNYKRFDLSFTLRSSIGNYVYNAVLGANLRSCEKANLYSLKEGGFKNVMETAYQVYWGEGFHSDSDYSNFNGNWYLSDYLVENASFLRCDNITLGYNFQKINLRIYGTVQNPFVITGYRGLDPEVSNGIDRSSYPRSMTTILGVNYNF